MSIWNYLKAVKHQGVTWYIWERQEDDRIAVTRQKEEPISPGTYGDLDALFKKTGIDARN